MIDPKIVAAFEQEFARELGAIRARLGDVSPKCIINIVTNYNGNIKISYQMYEQYDNSVKGADPNKVLNELYHRYGYSASVEESRSLTLLTYQQEGEVNAIDAQDHQGTGETPVNKAPGDQDPLQF